MDYTTIRITKSTHRVIKDLAKTSHLPLNLIIDKSVQYFAEKYFWDECQKAYNSLYSDKTKWKEESEERKVWNEVLMDDIY